MKFLSVKVIGIVVASVVFCAGAVFSSSVNNETLAVDSATLSDEERANAEENTQKEELKNKLAREKIKTDEKYKKDYLSKFKGSMPELSADDPIDINQDTGLITANKNARIVDKNFEVEADTIKFSRETGDGEVVGNARITLEQFRLLSKKINVNVDKKTLSALDSRFGFYPIFVETKEIKGDDKKVSAGDSTVYFGEPDLASLKIDVSNLSYNSENQLLEMEDAVFKIGPVPVFYLPYYSQEGLDKPPFKIKNRVGYNKDFGAYIQNTVYYRVNQNVDAGMLLDYYTKRSVLFGPATDYTFENDFTKFEGTLKGAYINDNGGADILQTDDFGKPITADRFFIDYKHKQLIADRFSLTGSLYYWSDQFVTRDFRPDMFYDNQIPDNFAEAMYYGDFYTASLFSRFAPDYWEDVQQRLPEARFDMLPTTILGSKFKHRFYTSYGYYREMFPMVNDTLTSSRMDSYYGIDRPISLNSWSTFTPLAGVRMTNYFDTLNSSGTYTRVLGQIGFDAQMDIWGTWNTRSRALGIDGVRHNFRPVMKYRFIPSASDGQSKIPEIDRMTFTSYPQVFDLGLMRNTDQMFDTNTLRTGIENVFQTRDSIYGSRDLARFDIYQDFKFKSQPYMLNPNDVFSDRYSSFSDTYVNISVSPSRFLTIGSFARIRVDSVDLAEINNYINVYDADALKVYLGNSYLSKEINQYYAMIEYRISENYRLIGRWNYDYAMSLLTEQTYVLWTRLGNSWVIEYQISYRKGAQREDNMSFGVRFNLYIF